MINELAMNSWGSLCYNWPMIADTVCGDESHAMTEYSGNLYLFQLALKCSDWRFVCAKVFLKLSAYPYYCMHLKWFDFLSLKWDFNSMELRTQSDALIWNFNISLLIIQRIYAVCASCVAEACLLTSTIVYRWISLRLFIILILLFKWKNVNVFYVSFWLVMNESICNYWLSALYLSCWKRLAENFKHWKI